MKNSNSRIFSFKLPLDIPMFIKEDLGIQIARVAKVPFRRSSSLSRWRGFFFILLFLFACTQQPIPSESTQLWHNQQRELRYYPDGNDFMITNGTHRFNRALYGSNTGFRIEAGDLPEFALYMPRMGGTLRLGLIRGDSSK